MNRRAATFRHAHRRICAASLLALVAGAAGLPYDNELSCNEAGLVWNHDTNTCAECPDGMELNGQVCKCVDPNQDIFDLYDYEPPEESNRRRSADDACPVPCPSQRPFPVGITGECTDDIPYSYIVTLKLNNDQDNKNEVVESFEQFLDTLGGEKVHVDRYLDDSVSILGIDNPEWVDKINNLHIVEAIEANTVYVDDMEEPADTHEDTTGMSRRSFEKNNVANARRSLTSTPNQNNDINAWSAQKVCNVGQGPSKNWGLARLSSMNPPGDMNVYEKHVAPRSAGQGVTIYLIDGGIDDTHVEFEDRIVEKWDCNLHHKKNSLDPRSYRGNVCPPGDSECAQDYDGHGTHVAGSAAGKTVGVAPSANIVSVMVYRRTTNKKKNMVKKIMKRKISDESIIVQALQFVCAPEGGGGTKAAPPHKRVVNMSVKYQHASKLLDKVMKKCDTNGVIVVYGSGNEGIEIDGQKETDPELGWKNNFIQNTPSSLVVGASSYSDEIIQSNYGRVIDIFAPGIQIYSSDLYDIYDPDRGVYKLRTGTSMATPHVTGAVAMLMSVSNMRGAEVVQEIITIAHKDKLHVNLEKYGSADLKQVGDDKTKFFFSDTPNRLLFTFFDPCKDDISFKECGGGEEIDSDGHCQRIGSATEVSFSSAFNQLTKKRIQQLSKAAKIVVSSGEKFEWAKENARRYGLEIRNKYLGWENDKGSPVLKLSQTLNKLLISSKNWVNNKESLANDWTSVLKLSPEEYASKITVTEGQVRNIESESETLMARTHLIAHAWALLRSMIDLQNQLQNPKVNMFYNTGYYDVHFDYEFFSADEELIALDSEPRRFVYHGTTSRAPEDILQKGILSEAMTNDITDLLKSSDLTGEMVKNHVSPLPRSAPDHLIFTSYKNRVAATHAKSKGWIYVIDTHKLKRGGFFSVNNYDSDMDMGKDILEKVEVAVLNIIPPTAIIAHMEAKTGLFSFTREGFDDSNSGEEPDNTGGSSEHKCNMHKPPVMDAGGLWGLARISPHNIGVQEPNNMKTWTASSETGPLGENTIIWILNKGGIDPTHAEFRRRQDDTKTRVIKRYNAQYEGGVCPDIPDDANLDEWEHECGFDDANGEEEATHVAGTAAGLNTGIATNAEIVSVALGTEASGIAEGINWVCKEMRDGLYTANKKQVVLMIFEYKVKQLIRYFTGDDCGNDIVVIKPVAELQSDDRQIDELPLWQKERFITVGSMNMYNQPSNPSTINKYISLFAPGTNVLSALPRGRGSQMEQCEEVLQRNGNSIYGLCSGTAMAAAHVAGAVANYWAMGAHLSAAEIKYMIVTEAKRSNPEMDFKCDDSVEYYSDCRQTTKHWLIAEKSPKPLGSWKGY